MTDFFRKLFNLRKGEESIATLMFLYLFFIISSLLVIKPVVNSLFLTNVGITKLPYAYLMVAIFAAAITLAYTNLTKKINFHRLLLYSLIIFVVCLTIFRVYFLFNLQGVWFYYLFYIWVAIFGTLATSQFWLLANYVFNAREAKRIFGFIGAGGISGGVFGGYFANLFAPELGTQNMLWFCILFLLFCIVILEKVWKNSARQNYDTKMRQERKRKSRHQTEPILKLVFGSKHLLYISAIIGISVIVANLVDYQYSEVASNLIHNPDDLTAFFGFWLSTLSIASLLFQLLFTSRILKFYGVITSLFFLPLGILIGAVAIIFSPALWSAVLIKVADGGFKQSINKSGMELLSLPIPGTIKNRTKSFIDIFVDSLATGIGGILLIIAIQLSLNMQQLSFLTVALVAVWILFIILVKKEYIDAFRHAIQKRTINLADQTLNLQEATLFDNIRSMLNVKNERQLLYTLQLLEVQDDESLIPYYKRLLKHPSPDVKIQTISLLENYEQDFSDRVALLAKDENFETMVAAIAYIARHSNDGINLLTRSIEDGDIKTRGAALIATAKLYQANDEFDPYNTFEQLFNLFLFTVQNDKECSETGYLKQCIARSIGIAKDPDLYHFLFGLLQDEDIDVVKAAVENAGQTRNPLFIPLLIQKLESNKIRRLAKDALVKYGEDALDSLEKAFNDPNTNLRIVALIPRVLAEINHQRSVNILFSRINVHDALLKSNIIKALNKLRVNFDSLKFDSKLINRMIDGETKNYYLTCSILYAFQENSKTGNITEHDAKSLELIKKSLNEQLSSILDRIFRLIAIIYPPADIYNAYLAVTSSNKSVRENAMEYLENILDRNQKQYIFPIIEQPSLNFLLERSKKFYNIKVNSEAEALEQLTQGNDGWLTVCALYRIAQSQSSDLLWIVDGALKHASKIVAETAEYAADRLEARAIKAIKDVE